MKWNELPEHPCVCMCLTAHLYLGSATAGGSCEVVRRRSNAAQVIVLLEAQLEPALAETIWMPLACDGVAGGWRRLSTRRARMFRISVWYAYPTQSLEVSSNKYQTSSLLGVR